MARSSGSIHVADNSVTAINDAIQQLLFKLDELSGTHDTVDINIGPHSHGTSTGGAVSHDDLADVSVDDHHDQLHSSTHGPGGTDALKLDDLASPDDNTDLNASATAHGLLPKLSNNASHFLDGTGSFTTPVVTGSEATDVANVEGSWTSEPWEERLVSPDWIFVLKSQDESITSDTALQNDNELFFPIAAGDIWLVEVVIFLFAGSSGDFAWSFTWPSGEKYAYPYQIAGSSTAFGSGDVVQGDWRGQYILGIGSGAIQGAAGGSAAVANAIPITIRLLIANGETAGTVQFQWAQLVSNGTATIVKAGSHLIARRL